MTEVTLSKVARRGPNKIIASRMTFGASINPTTKKLVELHIHFYPNTPREHTHSLTMNRKEALALAQFVERVLHPEGSLTYV